MILVTGATGQLGSAIIAQLLAKTPASNIAALARNEQKAAILREKGIHVRIADFDDAHSLDTAFEGIEKILLISTVDPNRFEQHKNVVDAAKKAGVKHIGYTSVTLNSLEDSAIKPLMESHFQTENYIIESGLSYTFFRNSLYADIIPLFAGAGATENGVRVPGGSGKVAYALRREMGEAIANALAGHGHENKSYLITGAARYSFADIAAALSELSGKDVAFEDVDADDFAQGLAQSGAPESLVWLVTGFVADIKAGNFDTESDDLERLLGRKPAGLKQALREIYNL